jgi:hypothetical protein
VERHCIDQLLRWLSGVNTRRAALRLLALVPVVGVLASLFDEESAARRRRRRRKARHHPGQHKDHRKGKRKGHHRRKRCKGKRVAKFCANRCGPVKKPHCKKLVDCGPCRVFVTSTAQQGNLGGLGGADAICQNLATVAGLPGTYLAWLSDATQSPATRFPTQSTGTYQLVNGTTIANSWTDLTDGALAAPINVTEAGLPQGGLPVYTSTKTNGTVKDPTQVCNGWTSNSNTFGAGTGDPDQTHASWTELGGVICTAPLGLYCFQQ